MCRLDQFVHIGYGLNTSKPNNIDLILYQCHNYDNLSKLHQYMLSPNDIKPSDVAIIPYITHNVTRFNVAKAYPPLLLFIYLDRTGFRM